MITFRHVSKRYEGHPVLHDVSFHIRRGEIVGLLGPSGVGKTTILRLVAGLTQPDAGQISVDPHARLGVVFQEPRLLPWRTAAANVRAAARATHRPHPAEAAQTWLAEVGLSAFARYYPAQLSGGMQQRVALARALAAEPDILLLDEPFSSLDAAHTDQLRARLRKAIRTQSSTVLYVTHVPAELDGLADRIFYLDPAAGLHEQPRAAE